MVSLTKGKKLSIQGVLLTEYFFFKTGLGKILATLQVGLGIEDAWSLLFTEQKMKTLYS